MERRIKKALLVMVDTRTESSPGYHMLDSSSGEEEWDTAAPMPIALGDDLAQATQRGATTRRRLLVHNAGEDIAAIIPIRDLQLLLRLEEQELDRIDRDAAHQTLADEDGEPTVPWAQVRQEASL